MKARFLSMSVLVLCAGCVRDRLDDPTTPTSTTGLPTSEPVGIRQPASVEPAGGSAYPPPPTYYSYPEPAGAIADPGPVDDPIPSATF